MIYTNENFLIKGEKLIIPFYLKRQMGLNRNKLFTFFCCGLYLILKLYFKLGSISIFEILIISIVVLINLPIRRGNTIWLNYKKSRYIRKNIKTFSRQTDINKIHIEIKQIKKVEMLKRDIKIKKQTKIEKW